MTERILVRAPNWLGDAVMAGPFLKTLAAQEPAAAMDILCRSSIAEVFRGFPGVGEIVTLAAGESPWATARRVRGRGYRTGYVLPPSFSAALSMRLAGIPVRIGHAVDFRGFLLTQAIPLDERFHYTRRYLDLLREAGRDINPGDFHFPRANAAEVAQVLSENGVNPTRLLAVAPGSRATARRWFPERFAEVINGLDARWTGAVLLGSPEDKPQADRVAALVRKTAIVNLCGKTSLALAAGILERCAALLTNESGLMHVGWAVGTPLVVAAGPSDPQATSPFGPRVQILQHREVPCVPCIRNDCYRAGSSNQECLKRITPIEVLDALREIP